MSDLVIVAFDNEETAFEARTALVKLQREYLIEMEDAVVITRKADGGVQLHQAINLPAIGAVGGGFWGALVGLLFLNPLLGAAVGAGAGALSGWMSDTGIDDNFLTEVGASVPPGGAALGVLIRKMTADRVLAAIGDFAGRGRVMRTSLTAAQEEALAQALGGKAQAAVGAGDAVNEGEGRGAITTSAPPAPPAGSQTGGEGSEVPRNTGGAFAFATDGTAEDEGGTLAATPPRIG